VSYEVIFDDESIEFLNKLEAKTKERIFDKIIQTKTNPYHLVTFLNMHKYL